MRLRTLLLSLIAFLDVSLLANHFGASLGESVTMGGSGEIAFGILVTTGGLLFYIIPFLSIPLALIAFILGNLVKDLDFPTLSFNSRSVFIVSSVLATLFFIQGYVFGSFEWPWRFFELLIGQ